MRWAGRPQAMPVRRGDGSRRWVVLGEKEMLLPKNCRVLRGSLLDLHEHHPLAYDAATARERADERHG